LKNSSEGVTTKSSSTILIRGSVSCGSRDQSEAPNGVWGEAPAADEFDGMYIENQSKRKQFALRAVYTNGPSNSKLVRSPNNLPVGAAMHGIKELVNNDPYIADLHVRFVTVGW
jgi:hypothetical protein